MTHTALKRALPFLRDHLAARPEAAARWQALGVEPGGTSSLARVLIGLALEDNTDGVVLFSTSRPERMSEIVEQQFPRDVLGAVRDEISRMSLGR